MIHRMGNGDADGVDIDPLWWVLGGTITTVVIYNMLQKRTLEQTNVAYTTESPLQNMNAVAVRFGQVRDLWLMGYISTDEVIKQLSGLVDAISDLQRVGKASPVSAQDLTSRIDAMLKDAAEYQAAA